MNLDPDTILENLNYATYMEFVNEILSIDRDALSESIAEQAVKYASFFGLMIEAKKRLTMAQKDQEKFMYDLEKDAHAQLVGKPGRKPTAKNIDMLVFSNEDYIRREKEIVQLDYVFGLTKGLVNAFSQRKDMLVQASAGHRQETKLYT